MYSHEMTCPHCNHKYSETYELFDELGGEYIFGCENCGESFIARQVVIISYETERE